jgi:hypothetical protein
MLLNHAVWQCLDPFLGLADRCAVRASCWTARLAAPLYALLPGEIVHESKRRLIWQHNNCRLSTRDGLLDGVQTRSGHADQRWRRGCLLSDTQSEYRRGVRHGAGAPHVAASDHHYASYQQHWRYGRVVLARSYGCGEPSGHCFRSHSRTIRERRIPRRRTKAGRVQQ